MAEVIGAKTTNEKVEQYKLLSPLLHAMYGEFQELSKKKPDGQVGKMKAKMVNRLLSPIYEILESEPTRVFLDLLDEDELPNNSDVVLILGQTQAAMSAYSSKYAYQDDSYKTAWRV
jgi:hypothetical protein